MRRVSPGSLSSCIGKLLKCILQSCSLITVSKFKQTIIKSLANESFVGSGYHSLGIIYGVFSASNLLAPTVVAIIGPRSTLILSGVIYSCYIAVFISPTTWSLYFTSVLIGIGAAMLWTAQGNYLVQNSSVSTINRNAGVFWSLLQCRYMQRATSAVNEAKSELRTMLQLFQTRVILLLSSCMAYSGLELTFYSGVYGTCIGATTHFGKKAKSLIGLSGILVGIGEIVGGGLFGLMCKHNRFRRTSVVILGMVAHFIAFYLIFLSIPNDASVVVKTSTQHEPYLVPSVPIALLCSFLLGLGDSCFNAQLYSLLGCVFAEKSAAAFNIFKLIQSLCAAGAFFYSGYLLLSWQLLAMVLLGISGTFCFFLVEKMQDAPIDFPEH
ncbi:UNC93-like protein MFSD11 isoform X4 [Anguilla anguilla]|uniref:UNC93-like protein MFSD11 isoform X4 n=1 Tax=Anguilla anguilla TaxID=7936 RepID=UPI0015AEEB2B|nr:UNC93-like protein MFSD11 isoform X4 [Anguilla anguilla]